MATTALLVYFFARAQRRHVRHTALLFLLAVLAAAGGAACRELSWPEGADTLAGVSALCQLLCEINFVTILFFDLLLPLLRVSLPGIVTDLATGAAYFVALLRTLHQAGVHPSGLVATSAVVTGVLGLSLAPTFGNVLGGVALQLDHSVHEGDWVQLENGTQGKVLRIGWRHTIIETRNWDTLIVPNAALLSGQILILGKRSGKPLQRRYWVYFHVDYRYPPGQVIAVVNEAVTCSPIPHVAAEPAAHAICFDLARAGSGCAEYAVRFWLTDLAVDDPTCSLVRERIYNGLQRAGIPLALPGTAVFVSQDDAEHKARKAERELQRRVDLLGQLDLFRDFKPDELRHLAERLHPTPFAEGEVMTRQGRVVHWLYILAEGAADVHLEIPEGGDVVLAHLKAPSYFGEMGAITGEPREATVVATRPSFCYRLDKEAFQKILSERKELAAHLSRVIAERRSQNQAAREHLTEEQQQRRVVQEQARLLPLIEDIFGLNEK